MPKLTNLGVSFISLVKEPANKKDIIIKASDRYNLTKPITITKSTPEGFIYGTVYEADKTDAHGDWADMSTIRKAAHEFLAKGKNANIDSEHNEVPNGTIMVESYTTDKSWEVVLQTDPAGEVFKKVQKGDYQGLSMMGTAVRKDENPPAQTTDQEEQIKQLKKSIEELTNIVKTIPLSKQLTFDTDGNIITKAAAEDTLFSEFKLLEV